MYKNIYLLLANELSINLKIISQSLKAHLVGLKKNFFENTQLILRILRTQAHLLRIVKISFN